MLQLISDVPAPFQRAIQGALIGDALGVPHEFKKPSALPRLDSIQMVMPSGYPKTYELIPYGTWSDDGSQMLALWDALKEHKGVYLAPTFARNLLAWFRAAKYQAGGTVFDVGGQTSQALRLLEKGQGAENSTAANRSGNGALMRVLPVAALPYTFPVEHALAVRIAMDQSTLTHPSVVSQVSCALYIELCWALAAGEQDFLGLPYIAAANLMARKVLSHGEQFALLDVLTHIEGALPTGSGYVANTLWSALWALRRSRSTSEALQTAVSLGDDTDTVACLTGGLAALAFGLDDLSLAWWGQMVLPPDL